MEQRVRVKGFQMRETTNILQYFDDFCFGEDVVDETKSDFSPNDAVLYFTNPADAATVIDQITHRVAGRKGKTLELTVSRYSEQSVYCQPCDDTARKDYCGEDADDIVAAHQRKVLNNAKRGKDKGFFDELPGVSTSPFQPGFGSRAAPPPYSTFDSHMTMGATSHHPTSAPRQPTPDRRPPEPRPRSVSPGQAQHHLRPSPCESRPAKPEPLKFSMFSVILKGLDLDTFDLDTLMMYFKSKRSNGGPLNEEKCSLDVSTGDAVITFKDPDVAERVLEKQDHVFSGHELEIFPGKMQPPQIPNRNCMIIHMSSAIDKEDLQLLIKNKWRAAYHGLKIPNYVVDFSGDSTAALITFSEPVENMTALIAKIPTKFTGIELSAKTVNKTHSILVEHLPARIHADQLELVFDSEDCPVFDIEMDQGDTSAIAHFKAFEYVDKICDLAHDGGVTLKNTTLKCSRYLPEFQAGCPEQPADHYAFDVELEIYILACMKQVKSYKDELDGLLNGVQASVEWKGGPEYATGKVQYHPCKQAKWPVEKWKGKVVAIFETFCQDFMKDFAECPEEIHEEVQSEVRQTLGIALPYKKDMLKFQIAGKTSDVRERKCHLEAIISSVKERNAKLRVPIVRQYSLESLYQPKLIQNIVDVSDFHSRFESVAVVVHDDDIELKGPAQQVDAAWEFLMDELASSEVEIIKFPSCHKQYEELFSDTRMMKVMQKLLRAEKLKCVLFMDGQQLQLVGVNSSHIEKAHEVVTGKVSDVVIKLDEDLHADPKFNSFVQKAVSDYNGIVKITIQPGAPCQVIVVGMVSSVGQVETAISNYLKVNVKITREVKMDVGKVRYIMDFQLLSLQEINRKNSVMIHPRRTKDAFSVEGSVANVSTAVSQLNELARTKIAEVSHKEAKPGIQKFLDEGHGRYQINRIESEEQCVIEKVEAQAAIDLGGDLWHSKRPIPAEPEMHMKAIHRTKTFQEIIACTGDITKQRVDVIVCPTNENLNHHGGLAGAIFRAGGDELEKECEYLQERYPLPGEIIEITAGKLPCSGVFLAVGPTWQDDAAMTSMRQEDRELSGCIQKSLEAMERLGFRSAAIPAISTGNNGYPVDRCTAVIVEAVKAYFTSVGRNSRIREVRLIGRETGVVNAFTGALKEKFGVVENVSSEDTDDSSLSDIFEGAEEPLYEDEGEGQTKLDINAPMGTKIHVLPGRLEEQQVEVIVNTMNTSMQLDTGAVSRAIGKRAGPNLQNYLDQLPHDPNDDNHGKIIVTPGFRLACNEIYHIFCSPYDNDKKGRPANELSTYVSMLMEKCYKNNISSIALPTIGTGGLGFPPKLAAQLILEVIVNLCKKNKLTMLKDIYVVGYNQDVETIKLFQQQCVKYCDKKNLTYDIEDGGQGSRATPSSGIKFSAVTSKGESHIIHIGHKMEFEAVLGDITKETTRAIVNPTNEALDLSVGNVSTAILRLGGDSIQEELHSIDMSQCPGIDQTVVTKAGSLPAKNIIHVVYDLAVSDISKCIANCLKAAEQKKFTSLAFPMIGTADGGQREVQGMAKSLRDELARFVQLSKPVNLKQVKVTIFDQVSHLQVFRNLMAEVEGKGIQEHLGLRAINMDQESINSVFQFASRPKKGLRFRLPEFKNPFADKKKPPVVRRENFQPQRTALVKPIVFLIYAETDAKCQSVKSKVKEMIAREFRAEVINDDHILHLPENVLNQIMQIGERNNVEVHVDKSDYMPRIKVTGPQQLRQDAIMRIKDLIVGHRGKVIEEEAIGHRACWYKVTDQDEFLKLSPTMIAQLEKHHEKGKKDCYITVDNCNYSVKFSGNEGTMKKSGSRIIDRIVRRDPMKELPIHWTYQEDSGVKVVQLKLNSKEMLEAQDFFMQTSGTFVSRVCKVERIENPTLYRQYIAQKRAIENRPGKPSSNEMRLFHGTQRNVCDNINVRGFNRAFSGRNFGAKYGKGTYFAVESSYSANDSFSPPDDNNQKYMYIVQFLAGEFTKGEEAMIELPRRDEGNPSSGYYDSAVDDVANPQVYVAFSDMSAYPQYLVTFE